MSAGVCGCLQVSANIWCGKKNNDKSLRLGDPVGKNEQKHERVNGVGKTNELRPAIEAGGHTRGHQRKEGHRKRDWREIGG